MRTIESGVLRQGAEATRHVDACFIFLLVVSKRNVSIYTGVLLGTGRTGMGGRHEWVMRDGIFHFLGRHSFGP